MKHIKLFEGFDKDDYYQRVSENDYNTMIEGGSFRPFDEGVVRLLRDLGLRVMEQKCSSNWLPKIWEDDDIVFMWRNFHTEHYSKHVMVYSMDDEWYLVRIVDHPQMGGVSVWKCDQLEGLVELLKDKNIIK